MPKNEDVLCLKIKYNIISYLEIIFVLFDFPYSELNKHKNKMYDLFEDKIVFTFNTEYKLSWIIAVPSQNHYNTIIFNSIGLTINKEFIPNKIYYHDGLHSN